jgi:hypothetical protein
VGIRHTHGLKGTVYQNTAGTANRNAAFHIPDLHKDWAMLWRKWIKPLYQIPSFATHLGHLPVLLGSFVLSLNKLLAYMLTCGAVCGLHSSCSWGKDLKKLGPHWAKKSCASAADTVLTRRFSFNGFTVTLLPESQHLPQFLHMEREFRQNMEM